MKEKFSFKKLFHELLPILLFRGGGEADVKR